MTSIENFKAIGLWSFLTHILLNLSFSTQCASLTYMWTLTNPPSSESLPYCKLSLKWKHLLVHEYWTVTLICTSVHLNGIPFGFKRDHLLTWIHHQLHCVCLSWLPGISTLVLLLRNPRGETPGRYSLMWVMSQLHKRTQHYTQPKTLRQ